MSTHKQIDKICCIVLALTLVLSALFCFSGAFGVEVAARTLGYESRLFSDDKVHTIDIIIDDWDAFISTAQSEEYSVCSVVIDGEAVKNVGIRGKGNTSLSSVSSMNSQRYSFKIEFDQYDNTQNYHGLDKLSLNNLIQDNTYMKDYLVYKMMAGFGVDAPLCSYAYITVNGEDWGLYLAVEGIEDSFLQRNYGANHGELYKPDSLSFGGGRGNGMDFDISDFATEDGGFDFSIGNMPNMDGATTDTGTTKPDMGGSMPDFGSGGSFGGFGDMPSGSSGERPDMGSFGDMSDFGGFGGMGSSDVKLQYIDDDPSSYSNIFNNAKTDVTEADMNRLISSIKQLSEYSNIEEVVDIDEVLRYFVVHNFVVNDDSYTGSMIHNYYLYEENGVLSMIPWDYNLAFGTFMGANASSSVNESIDDVLSDRPMQAWIFSSEEYSAQYYALYAEMLEVIDIQGIISNADSLISEYVKKDPTAFCTYEEYEKGLSALKQFCSLRAESVALQLESSDATVNAGGLNISDMGTMGSGGGFGGMGERPSKSDGETSKQSNSGKNGGAMLLSDTAETGNNQNSGMPGGMPGGMGSFDPSNIPGGMGNFDPENMPGGMGDFDPENIPGGMQIPGWSQEGSSFPSSNSGTGNTNRAPAASSETTLLVTSVLFLLGGLAFAYFFKRRK